MNATVPESTDGTSTRDDALREFITAYRTWARESEDAATIIAAAFFAALFLDAFLVSTISESKKPANRSDMQA